MAAAGLGGGGLGEGGEGKSITKFCATELLVGNLR